MDTLSRTFPFSKELMLNILYDTLEKTGFSLDSANSERGTLIVSSSDSPNHRIRIACERSVSENQSIIHIFPAVMDNTGRQRAEMLMEEVISTVKQSIENHV